MSSLRTPTLISLQSQKVQELIKPSSFPWCLHPLCDLSRPNKVLWTVITVIFQALSAPHLNIQTPWTQVFSKPMHSTLLLSGHHGLHLHTHLMVWSYLGWLNSGNFHGSCFSEEAEPAEGTFASLYPVILHSSQPPSDALTGSYLCWGGSSPIQSQVLNLCAVVFPLEGVSGQTFFFILNVPLNHCHLYEIYIQS